LWRALQINASVLCEQKKKKKTDVVQFTAKDITLGLPTERTADIFASLKTPTIYFTPWVMHRLINVID
jgi:hypothetical protein